MANKDEITCSEESGCFDGDTASFLKESNIEATAAKLNDVPKIDDILGGIRNEISDGGLAEGALLLEGRAPLYDLATQLVSHIQQTGQDFDLVGKAQIIPCGNLHMQDEANQYYEKAKEQYQKYLERLRTAIDNYNNHLDYTYTETDSEGAETQKSGSYTAIIVTIEENSDSVPPNIKTEDTNPNDKSGQHGVWKEAVDTAYTKARAFYYNPIVPAIKLKDKCAELDTKYNEIDTDTYEESPIGEESTEPSESEDEESTGETFEAPDGKKYTYCGIVADGFYRGVYIFKRDGTYYCLGEHGLQKFITRNKEEEEEISEENLRTEDATISEELLNDVKSRPTEQTPTEENPTQEQTTTTEQTSTEENPTQEKTTTTEQTSAEENKEASTEETTENKDVVVIEQDMKVYGERGYKRNPTSQELEKQPELTGVIDNYKIGEKTGRAFEYKDLTKVVEIQNEDGSYTRFKYTPENELDSRHDYFYDEGRRYDYYYDAEGKFKKTTSKKVSKK